MDDDTGRQTRQKVGLQMNSESEDQIFRETRRLHLQTADFGSISAAFQVVSHRKRARMLLLVSRYSLFIQGPLVKELRREQQRQRFAYEALESFGRSQGGRRRGWANTSPEMQMPPQLLNKKIECSWKWEVDGLNGTGGRTSTVIIPICIIPFTSPAISTSSYIPISFCILLLHSTAALCSKIDDCRYQNNSLLKIYLFCQDLVFSMFQTRNAKTPQRGTKMQNIINVSTCT